MSMYDSFYLKAKCPVCKRTETREFQTKQFVCSMEVWKKGDVLRSNGIEIYCGIIKNVYSGCIAKDCGEMWERKNRPNTFGFGRPICADVLIIGGRVIKAINIRVNNGKK